MHITSDHTKVTERVQLQIAYRLLCLLYKPISRSILEVLSHYPPYQLNNARLVLMVNRIGGYHKLLQQSEVSQFISQLRRKNIILSERRGKEIYYALNVDRLIQINAAIHSFIHSKPNHHVTTSNPGYLHTCP